MLRVVISCLIALSVGLAFGAGIADDVKANRGSDVVPLYEPSIEVALAVPPSVMPEGAPVVLRPLQYGPSVEEAIYLRAMNPTPAGGAEPLIEPAAPPPTPTPPPTAPAAPATPDEAPALAPTLPPDETDPTASAAPSETPPIAVPPPVALEQSPETIPLPLQAGLETTNPVQLISPIENAPALEAPSTTAPMVALVIDDLGNSEIAAQRIFAWPVSVTVSILPYGHNLEGLVQAARGRGHGVMLHLPMEPDGSEDPGPMPLLTSLPKEELKSRIEWNFTRLSDFDGVNNHMGSRFTRDETALRLVFDEIGRRGLFFLDSFTTPQSIGVSLAHDMTLPVLKRDVFLDTAQIASSVAARLADVETIAREKGYAVAIGHPHPLTLTMIEEWIPHAQEVGLRFVTTRELVREVSSQHLASLATPGG